MTLSSLVSPPPDFNFEASMSLCTKTAIALPACLVAPLLYPQIFWVSVLVGLVPLSHKNDFSKCLNLSSAHVLFPSCIRPKLSERCFEPDWNDKKRDPTIEPAPPLSRWTMVQLDYGGSVRLQPHAPLKHHLWHPFQTTIGSLGSRPCSLQPLVLPRPRFGRRATA